MHRLRRSINYRPSRGRPTKSLLRVLLFAFALLGSATLSGCGGPGPIIWR
jgi:hypothetical protein